MNNSRIRLVFASQQLQQVGRRRVEIGEFSGAATPPADDWLRPLDKRMVDLGSVKDPTDPWPLATNQSNDQSKREPICVNDRRLVL